MYFIIIYLILDSSDRNTHQYRNDETGNEELTENDVIRLIIDETIGNSSGKRGDYSSMNMNRNNRHTLYVLKDKKQKLTNMLISIYKNFFTDLREHDKLAIIIYLKNWFDRLNIKQNNIVIESIDELIFFNLNMMVSSNSSEKVKDYMKDILKNLLLIYSEKESFEVNSIYYILII